MKNIKIHKLAFTGKMGAGKTAASLIVMNTFKSRYPIEPEWKNVALIKFANPIYSTLKAFHREDKPRVFMQRIGDLARREFGDKVFEDIFEENVTGFINNMVPTLSTPALIITDDLRFRGEYNLLRKLGFKIIRIEASENIRKPRLGPTFTNLQHRSEIEQELFEPDLVIDNDTNQLKMDNFKQQVKQLLVEQNILERDDEYIN